MCTARLASAELLQARQDRVEDYITTLGRELQRQLLQDHVDLRAATEERAAEVTGADGVVRGGVGRPFCAGTVQRRLVGAHRLTGCAGTGSSPGGDERRPTDRWDTGLVNLIERAVTTESRTHHGRGASDDLDEQEGRGCDSDRSAGDQPGPTQRR
jgi:hypothetical protein